MDRERLGKRIAALRKSAGMNQEDLSHLSGVSSRALSDIEGGKGNPGLKNIESIEKTLKNTLVTLADTLHRPPNECLEQLINEPENAQHLTVNSVLARLMGEKPQIRAAVLAVLYGDPTISRLSALSDKKGSR